MKRLITTLSVIITLLLIASPVMAGAETIDVMALQLSDPVVYMNDEPIADMTGLMLQLTGGSTADGSLSQMFVDVFAGGETVGSAMAQMDENGLAGYLGGMTSAYGISADAMGEIPIEGLNVTNLNEFMDALENWTLFDDLGALVSDFGENGLTYGDPETIEVDLAAGKTNMTYVPMTGDMTAFTYSLLSLLENDPILGQAFASMMEESGYASITDMLQEGGFGNAFSGGVASTEDGASAMIEADLVLTMYEEPVHIDMNLIVDGSMGDTQYMTMTANMYPDTADESITLTVNTAVTGDDATIDGTFATNFSEEDENVEASFSMSFASAAGAGAGTDMLDITFEVPDEGSMTLSASSVEATGETHFAFDIKDDASDVSAYLNFTPAASADASVILSGTVDMGFNDGTDTYSVISPVNLVMTTIDTDDFYIAPENVIDAANMTDEQTETAQTEMGMVMIQVLTKIEAAVPGLEGLTAGFIGSSQQ